MLICQSSCEPEAISTYFYFHSSKSLLFVVVLIPFWYLKVKLEIFFRASHSFCSRKAFVCWCSFFLEKCFSIVWGPMVLKKCCAIFMHLNNCLLQISYLETSGAQMDFWKLASSDWPLHCPPSAYLVIFSLNYYKCFSSLIGRIFSRRHAKLMEYLNYFLLN